MTDTIRQMVCRAAGRPTAEERASSNWPAVFRGEKRGWVVAAAGDVVARRRRAAADGRCDWDAPELAAPRLSLLINPCLQLQPPHARVPSPAADALLPPASQHQLVPGRHQKTITRHTPTGPAYASDY